MSEPLPTGLGSNVRARFANRCRSRWSSSERAIATSGAASIIWASTRRYSTAYQPVVSIMKTLNFSAIRARQSPEHTVLSFAASASELQTFAAIERVGRAETGTLNGFQRSEIAGHIQIGRAPCRERGCHTV